MSVRNTPLRVRWGRLALRQLATLRDRSPGRALAVYDAAHWLAERGMANLGRPDPRGQRRRYWPVPPHGIFYAVRDGWLWVLEIRDMRRWPDPW